MALLYSLQPRKNTFLSFFMFHIQLQLNWENTSCDLTHSSQHNLIFSLMFYSLKPEDMFVCDMDENELCSPPPE